MISTERVQLYGSKCQDVWLKNYQIFPMHCYGSTEIVEILLCCLVSAVPYITAAYVLFSKKGLQIFQQIRFIKKYFVSFKVYFFRNCRRTDSFVRLIFWFIAKIRSKPNIGFVKLAVISIKKRHLVFFIYLLTIGLQLRFVRAFTRRHTVLR